MNEYSLFRFCCSYITSQLRDKASGILETVALQNFRLIYSTSNFSRIANKGKKKANSLTQKNLITKTEAQSVHHLAHRFASKKAKGKEELLENTDRHISTEVCFHVRGGEDLGQGGEAVCLVGF